MMKRNLPSMDSRETTWGFVFLFAQLILIPLVVLLVIERTNLSVSAAMENILCFGANFLCALCIFRRFWVAALKAMGGNGFRLLTAVLLHFMLYFVGMLLVNALVYQLDPEFSNANDDTIAAIMGDQKMLMILGVVVLVPPVEEVLYRGLIFGNLHARSPLLAYLVSIAAFGTIHVLAYIGSVSPARLLLCFLQYIPAGFFLARAYAVSGSIFAPILMHAMINLIACFSM